MQPSTSMSSITQNEGSIQLGYYLEQREKYMICRGMVSL